MPGEGRVSELSADFQSKTSMPVKKLCIVACVCSPNARERGLKRKDRETLKTCWGAGQVRTVCFQFCVSLCPKAVRQNVIEEDTQHPSLASASTHMGVHNLTLPRMHCTDAHHRINHLRGTTVIRLRSRALWPPRVWAVRPYSGKLWRPQ